MEEKEIYKIFYIPFDVETYIPITPDNIEKNAHYVFEKSSKEIDRIFIYSKQCKSISPLRSDFKTTRAKIIKIKSGEFINIDQDRYLLIDNKQCLLEKIMFDSLAAFLEKNKETKGVSTKSIGPE